MTTTFPVTTQPDLEAFVWSAVSAIDGVTSFTVAAVHDWIGWAVAYTLQIDARGSTKSQARDRAERARQTITGLPALNWADGTVTYVQPVEGPFWFPDADDGTPRYTARYEIRCHPLRAAPKSR